MDGANAQVPNVTGMEEKLAASLMATADEVAHAECFDTEQRAEVYAILSALKGNTETHRAMIRKLALKLVKEQGDA